MIKLKQAIVVEGRYDQNTLAQVVDAPIITTNGFGIFRDQKRIELLRRVAEQRGLVVLTDSDGAGFLIRNRIKSVIAPQYLYHAYIPDIYGKERRKDAPGREGKLGVEGMTPQILLEVLRRSGAELLEEDPGNSGEAEITKQDFYDTGLSGRPESRQRRLALQKALGLPEHLSANALLTALNCMLTREDFLKQVTTDD